MDGTAFGPSSNATAEQKNTGLQHLLQDVYDKICICSDRLKEQRGGVAPATDGDDAADFDHQDTWKEIEWLQQSVLHMHKHLLLAKQQQQVLERECEEYQWLVASARRSRDDDMEYSGLHSTGNHSPYPKGPAGLAPEMGTVVLRPGMAQVAGVSTIMHEPAQRSLTAPNQCHRAQAPRIHVEPVAAGPPKWPPTVGQARLGGYDKQELMRVAQTAMTGANTPRAPSSLHVAPGVCTPMPASQFVPPPSGVIQLECAGTPRTPSSLHVAPAAAPTLPASPRAPSSVHMAPGMAATMPASHLLPAPGSMGHPASPSSVHVAPGMASTMPTSHLLPSPGSVGHPASPTSMWSNVMAPPVVYASGAASPCPRPPAVMVVPSAATAARPSSPRQVQKVQPHASYPGSMMTPRLLLEPVAQMPAPHVPSPTNASPPSSRRVASAGPCTRMYQAVPGTHVRPANFVTTPGLATPQPPRGGLVSVGPISG